MTRQTTENYKCRRRLQIISQCCYPSKLFNVWLFDLYSRLLSLAWDFQWMKSFHRESRLEKKAIRFKNGEKNFQWLKLSHFVYWISFLLFQWQKLCRQKLLLTKWLPPIIPNKTVGWFAPKWHSHRSRFPPDWMQISKSILFCAHFGFNRRQTENIIKSFQNKVIKECFFVCVTKRYSISLNNTFHAMSFVVI